MSSKIIFIKTFAPFLAINTVVSDIRVEQTSSHFAGSELNIFD